MARSTISKAPKAPETFFIQFRLDITAADTPDYWKSPNGKYSISFGIPSTMFSPSNFAALAENGVLTAISDLLDKKMKELEEKAVGEKKDTE